MRVPGRADPVVAEYAGLARHYDRRWARYVEATTARTLARIDPKPGDRVLDIGCGTGTMLGALRRRFPDTALSGVDLSPEMLARARAKLPAEVGLARARAESLPFADGSFELAISTSVLHFVLHPEAALREIGRVLAPGGAVVITDWCDDFLACRLCDAALRLFGRGHFHTYGGEECARMLRAAGLACIEVERYKVSMLWGMMTARGRKP